MQPPIRISGNAVEYKGGPTVGQHTREVLVELLGIGADELDVRVTDGVI